MSLRVEVHESIKNLNRNQLDTLVKQSSNGSAFFRYGWFSAIEDTQPFDTRIIVVNKKSNPVGFLPTYVREIGPGPFRQIGRPWPGFSEPIILTDEKQVLGLLLDRAENLCSGTLVSHRLRFLSNSYLGYGTELKTRGYVPNVDSCRFQLKLTPSYDKALSRMSQSKRRRFEDIVTSDTYCEIIELTQDNLHEFYNKYTKHVSRLNAEPLPYDFFDALATELKDRLQLVVAKHEDRPVGYRLSLLDPDRSVIHLIWIAMEESDYQYNVSECIYSFMMRWGIENNYELLDLGGTAPDITDGSFVYKSELGGSPIPIMSWQRVRGGDITRGVKSIYDRMQEKL